MFTILSFILTLLGSVNWLLIGLLQYDFVAGIFGFQSSILSRIVYIIVGLSSLFLVYKLIKGKGTIAVFSYRNKKDLQKNVNKVLNKEPSQSNVEASKELSSQEPRRPSYDEYDEDYEPKREPRGLFNEHFDERDNDL